MPPYTQGFAIYENGIMIEVIHIEIDDDYIKEIRKDFADELLDLYLANKEQTRINIQQLLDSSRGGWSSQPPATSQDNTFTDEEISSIFPKSMMIKVSDSDCNSQLHIYKQN